MVFWQFCGGLTTFKIKSWGKWKTIVLLYSATVLHLLKLLDSTLSQSVGLQTECCFPIPFLRENLYSSSLGGGVATSPMLIVFHGKYSTINPLWHIRHLGEYFRKTTQMCILWTQWGLRWGQCAGAPGSIEILQVTLDTLFNPQCSDSANAMDKNAYLRGMFLEIHEKPLDSGLAYSMCSININYC